MKIGLYGKNFKNGSSVYLQQLVDKIRNMGGGLYVYEPAYEQISKMVNIACDPVFFNTYEDIRGQLDCLLSVGGDGTLLDTITMVRDSGIPVFGINMGRMGFLSSIAKDEIIPALDCIASGDYTIEERTLLHLDSDNALFGDLNFALNEISIYKKDPYSMLTIRTTIDEKFLTSYWADGLIVATPTGSTAYSLSCGGPILTPGSQNFVISPIATHNLTVRPIVIPDDSCIRLKVEGRNRAFFVSLDSRFKLIDSSLELTIRKEKFKIGLLRLKNENFYKTIREKLKWGLDIRN